MILIEIVLNLERLIVMELYLYEYQVFEYLNIYINLLANELNHFEQKFLLYLLVY
jgi:hypothetical protein